MRGNTVVQRQRTELESRGLRSEEVVPLREQYGTNTFTKKKQPGFFRQFLHNCNDPIIRILIGALLCNIVFLFPHINWYESAGIAAAVFISAFVSTLSEYSGSKAFARLYEQLGDTEYTVFRDGKPQQIHIGDIVTYDLVSVAVGDMIPADGILIEGCLLIDESSLTGESKPIRKTACTDAIPRTDDLPVMEPGNVSALFRGSSVLSGEGKCVVTHVGDSTMYGALASALQEENTPSPLKERLTTLAKTISKIGYVSAAVVAFAYLFQAFFISSGMQFTVMLERMRDLSFVWRECLHAFTMAISIIVVAVPEGLPMMITVVLSSNMKRMMKNGVLVRKLIGIETSGCLSMLFTDKTGTLTSGKLRVKEVFSLSGTYDNRAKLQKVPMLYQALSNGSALCASSLHGNATDTAIQSFLEADSAVPLSMIPFDSARKFCAARTESLVYVRGAPEYILPYCTFSFTADGTCKTMTGMEHRLVEETMRKAALKSQRVVMQAICDPVYYSALSDNRLATIPFTFQALYLIEDEIRPQVPEAVQSCRSAGIHVVMLTGDNEITAASIAQRTGIIPGGYQFYAPEDALHENSLVLRGKDLAALSDDVVEELLPKIAVIARVTPTDKSRLVRIAKHAGHVVGMTGDGVNDAPALRCADVGFAMGSGSDITREAGDIVITDDNFASITKAILFGRTIFESIRKFIVFQLIMNLSAVGVSMLGPLFHIPNPVTVIQMLWVNIIMDTLGSLAFAGEAPLAEYMRRPPVARGASILNGKMLRQILFSATYTIALCMAFLTSERTWYRYGHGDMVYFLTAFFALFIFCGICNAFTVRTTRVNLLAHLKKNKCFLIIMPAVAVIQLVIIYFGGTVFRTTPLHMRELLVCAGFAMSILPLDTIRKLIWR